MKRIYKMEMEKITEGIISAIHRMAKEILVERPDSSLEQPFDKMMVEEIIEKILNFKGSLWMYKGKIYMVQQPVEPYNID